MTMAAITTSVTDAAILSLRAPTEAATASEADTPQTEPAVPSTAAKRRSSPKTRVATKKIIAAVRIEMIADCVKRNAAGRHDQRDWKGCPKEHNAGLDVKLDPQRRFQALRNLDQIGERKPADQRNECGLEIVEAGIFPACQRRYEQQTDIDQREAGQKFSRTAAPSAAASRQRRSPIR